MRLKSLELNGFKSFHRKTSLEFRHPVVSIVGPNGSGKSNVVEAIRFVLGEQSIKSMRGSSGTDLIFKGSKNLTQSSRASVTIYFNNSDRIFKLEKDSNESFNLNYDIVSISREVYSDGLNKYILNGTEVRLKDISALLSSVHIGSSGHHIISQGESDRILNASLKERKEMVEDALGLKIYQFKIKESERKLEKTDSNMKEISLLRRENAPHLNFLQKQIEKLEKVKELQIELTVLYTEYFSIESVRLEKEKTKISGEKNKIQTELDEISLKMPLTEENIPVKENSKIAELKIMEQKLSSLRSLREEISRKLGRIEGLMEIAESKNNKESEVIQISQEEIQNLTREINSLIDAAYSKDNLSEVRSILENIKNVLKKFIPTKASIEFNADYEIINLKENQKNILAELKNLENSEKEILNEIEFLKENINEEMQSLRDLEKEKFSLQVKQQELSSSLRFLKDKEENLSRDKVFFENETREALALVGSEALNYKNLSNDKIPISSADFDLQAEKRKKIERIKIKLEDAGVANSADIIKEFNDVNERDEFLAKEMEDLNKSIESLKQLIVDLKQKIDTEFKEGIKKINTEFNNLFALVFGGGGASLEIVSQKKNKREKSEYLESLAEESDEEIIFEQGVEIRVSLPRKKIKELNALSGGERSLTSIALLFAMSQVNPPPFLVLDETDAVLDEANSRKYGDMLEKLSKHSQLIVVTHNRETMSRAGILYGVTIGVDGASKLLSVELEEAKAIAK